MGDHYDEEREEDIEQVEPKKEIELNQIINHGGYL